MKAVLTLVSVHSYNFKLLQDPRKLTIAVTIIWAESVKYRGLQSGDEGGKDRHFSAFFVADILKLALEEACSTNFSQLTFYVHC